MAFKNLAALATGTHANLYAVDGNRAQVENFDSAGHYLLEWGSRGKWDAQLFPLPDSPWWKGEFLYS